MKDATNNTPITTIVLNQTMTTLEIAEITGKNHYHVLRDVRDLIDQEAITESSFGASEYKDASGKTNVMYTLDFQATMTLITGYNAKLRARVIARWRKLEEDSTPEFMDREAMDGFYEAGFLDGRAQAKKEIAIQLSVLSDHRLITLRRASRYRAMGLTNREVGKLMDTHKYTVRKAVRQSRSIGVLGVPDPGDQLSLFGCDPMVKAHG